MTYQRTALASDGKFTTRSADDGKFIEGYFAVFNSEYKMWSDTIETIACGAFSDTLNGDIRALVNHDSTLVLGRTSAGTLELKEDGVGLWGSIRINEADQDAMNLYERVRRGDVSQCSFGFDILDQDYDITGGVTIWTVRKVKLYEVSVVTFPAYEDTAVIARKRDYEAIREEKRNSWRDAIRKRLKGE